MPLRTRDVPPQHDGGERAGLVILAVSAVCKLGAAVVLVPAFGHCGRSGFVGCVGDAVLEWARRVVHPAVTWFYHGFIDQRMVEAKLNFFLIGAPRRGHFDSRAALATPSGVFESHQGAQLLPRDIDPGGFSPRRSRRIRPDLEACIDQKPLGPRRLVLSATPRYAALLRGDRPSTG